MRLDQLITLTTSKLGEQSLFYPPQEVVDAGLNPAQRLLCVVYPQLLSQRVAVSIGEDQPFLDLRTLTDTHGAPLLGRVRKVKRVVLGTSPALEVREGKGEN